MDNSNSSRSCIAPVAALVLIAATAWIPATARGQTESPRTPWGAPDLNGIWSHGTATPLERPEEQGDRELLTDAEIAEINAAQRSTEGVGARRVVWWERSLSDGRTSMIVDPPNGRIPYSEAGLARVRARPGQTSEGPEGRSPQERCISYGIPRLGGPYSQNIHIAQTPDHVLLLFEMVHEFRIIPLDGRPHLPGHVRQWLGDSRGHWDAHDCPAGGSRGEPGALGVCAAGYLRPNMMRLGLSMHATYSGRSCPKAFHGADS